VFVLLLLAVHGCTYRTRHVVSATEPFPQLEGRPVRVTLVDGRVLLMNHARVVGDSLAGDIIDRRDGRVARGAVPLRDIRVVDEEHIALWQTISIGTAVAAASLLVWMFANMPRT
jgi:hypothetical protein